MNEREELANDPVLGPLVRELDEAKARLNVHAQHLGAHATTYLRDHFSATLGRLKQADPDLDVSDFLNFCQRSPAIDRTRDLVDLDATYRAYAHNRLVARAEKQAREQGEEQGRREAGRAPRFQPRYRPKHLEGVETLDQAEEAAMRDPDILQTLDDWIG